MTFGELLEWQWSDYAEKHRDRTNLLIHIFAVPLFVIAFLGLLAALLRLSIFGVLFTAGCMGLSLLLQSQAHSFEESPPEPFRGAGDFVRRLFAEQFITFPRFVASGGWSRNLARAHR